MGILDDSDISKFREIDSPLQGHPDKLRLPYMHATTGSLGQGLSIEIGHALAMKLKSMDKKCFCIVGDGEIQEGQIWEAFMLAPKFKLDNLICFIDSNKLGEERSFCTYYGGTGVFSNEEVDKIKKTGDSLTNETAKTFGQGDQGENRKGSVGWLPLNESNKWIYSRLLSITEEANNSLWKFDLTGFWEDCQYTTYEASSKKDGDFYDYHLDIDGSYGVQRKISIVVQLSDQEDYEGGEL